MEVWLSWMAVSAAVVCVYWLKLHYAAKHGVGGRGNSPRLADDLAELKIELRETCDDLANQIEQLNERMDFAERLLADRGHVTRLEPPRPQA